MRARRTWIVPVIVFVVCATLTTHGKFSVSGDEPHYLAVAQSLWSDHDLDLRNNYEPAATRRFGVERLDVELHARQDRFGTLFPVHDIGMPLLLAPVYGAAAAVSRHVPDSLLARVRMNQGRFAYSIVSWFIIVLTCAAAAITRAALVRDGTPPRVAAAIVLVAWLSPPILSHSFLVFPEPAALLATAWALHVVLDRRPDRPASDILLIACALGVLPWFHRKFVVYAAAMVVSIVWLRRDRIQRLSWRVRLAAVLLLVAPAVALFAWTWRHWGNLAGPMALDGLPLWGDMLAAGVVGHLVDRENGLFVWAPVYLLLPAAWMLTWRRTWIWLLPVLSLYVLSAAHMWWGGFAPAARFLVPLVPIFCHVGVVIAADRLLRRVAIALLVPQALITAYAWQTPRALWPRGDGNNRVLEGFLLDRVQWLLPSLRTSATAYAHALVVLALVTAANVAASVGRQPQAFNAEDTENN